MQKIDTCLAMVQEAVVFKFKEDSLKPVIEAGSPKWQEVVLALETTGAHTLMRTRRKVVLHAGGMYNVWLVTRPAPIKEYDAATLEAALKTATENATEVARVLASSPTLKHVRACPLVRARSMTPRLYEILDTLERTLKIGLVKEGIRARGESLAM